MRLTARAYRLPRYAVIIAGLTILGSLLPGLVVRIPRVTEAFSGLLTVLIAAAVCLVIARMMTVGWPGDRVVAVRPVRRHLALVVAIAVVPIPGLATAVELAGFGSGAVFAGVLGWLLAGQLLTAVFLSSRYQAATPGAYLLLAATVGISAGRVRGWAWPLGAPEGIDALTLGGPVFAISLVLLAVLGPHPQR